MSSPNPFTDLIRRIRRGDACAAEELVRQYEPVIRLEVRLRLKDPRLRRVLDSMDICQSVWASFFVRAAAGEYDLDAPEQLGQLLVKMACNKLAFQARKFSYQRRDRRRLVSVNLDQLPDADSRRGVGPQLAWQELLTLFRQHLNGEERQLAACRAEGISWADIAAQLGGTPQGRRKQLERAIDRVSGELGLDGDLG